MDTLREKLRVALGREESPSLGIIDSRSVKTTQHVDDEGGIDGNKKIKRRKDQVVVDTQGLPMAVYVHEAAYYNNKAANYLREAEYYARRGDYDRAATNSKWASDAADQAMTEARRANTARDNARDQMRWAKDALDRAK